MSELAFEQGSAPLGSDSTKKLIQAGVSDITLKAYQKVLLGPSAWLDTELNDAMLAAYITQRALAGIRRGRKKRDLGRCR